MTSINLQEDMHTFDAGVFGELGRPLDKKLVAQVEAERKTSYKSYLRTSVQ